MASLLIFVSALTQIACAQPPVQAVREDGAQTPLRVYAPSANGCAPLAVISPGAGGSEDGYRYLATALQEDGWQAIVMGHRESGATALGIGHAEVRRHQKRPARTGQRSEGLRCAIDGHCGSAEIGHERLQTSICHVALDIRWGRGRSWSRPARKIRSGVKGLDRFDAYVALSPDGPGKMFPDNAWSGIRKPILILTGTKDQSLDGDWKTRTIPYDSLPSGCKWLGVIDGATHMNFAGIGFAGSTEKLTLLETKSFLDGLRGGKCGAPVPADGIAVKSK